MFLSVLRLDFCPTMPCGLPSELGKAAVRFRDNDTTNTLSLTDLSRESVSFKTRTERVSDDSEFLVRKAGMNK